MYLDAIQGEREAMNAKNIVSEPAVWPDHTLFFLPFSVKHNVWSIWIGLGLWEAYRNFPKMWAELKPEPCWHEGGALKPCTHPKASLSDHFCHLIKSNITSWCYKSCSSTLEFGCEEQITEQRNKCWFHTCKVFLAEIIQLIISGKFLIQCCWICAAPSRTPN